MARNKKNKNYKNSSKKEETSAKTVSRGGESDTTVGIKPEGVESPSNDPAWYSVDPQLLIDSANIQWSEPTGRILNVVDDTDGLLAGGQVFIHNGAEARNLTIAEPLHTWGEVGRHAGALPGILSLVIRPTMGYARDRHDPINQLANQIYTQTRYMVSGRKNYDPCDEVIYVLAVTELQSFKQWVERLYKYSFMYSQENLYIGTEFIKANGVDPDDLRANLANLRAWMDTFVQNIASYCIPGTMSYIHRRVFMYSGYYLENPYANIKDQLYQFVPDGFYRFKLDAHQKGMLEFFSLRKDAKSNTTWSNGRQVGNNSRTYMTVSEIIDYGNALFNSILGDEDFALMSGDILKAFNGNLMTVTPMNADEGIIPVYDPYVLSQFKNATVFTYIDVQEGERIPMRAEDQIYAGDVGQDDQGNIISGNAVDIGRSGLWTGQNYLSAYMKKVLSVENPNPGPGDTIEATRLTVGSRPIVPSAMTSMVLWLDTGTEICVGCEATKLDDPNLGLHHREAVYLLNNSYISRLDYLNDPSIVIANIHTLMKFKYCPHIYYLFGSEVASDDAFDVSDIMIMNNIDTYSTVTREQIRSMHRCALFSLLYVPTVAKNLNH